MDTMHVMQHGRVRAHRRAGRLVLCMFATLALCALPARAQRSGAGAWSPYTDGRLGFSFTYPAATFSVHAWDPTAPLSSVTAVRSGVTLASRDGKAWLLAGAYANAEYLTLAIFRQRMLTGTYAGARVTFERLTPSLLIVSGTQNGTEFYERVMLSCNGRMVNYWLLTYPAAENRFYDRVVEEIARTFQPVLGREGCEQAFAATQ